MATKYAASDFSELAKSVVKGLSKSGGIKRPDFSPDKGSPELDVRPKKKSYRELKAGEMNVNIDPSVDETAGFESFGEFIKATLPGQRFDPRLKALVTTGDPGYAIPTSWAEQLYDVLVDNTSFFSRCRVAYPSGNYYRRPYSDLGSSRDSDGVKGTVATPIPEGTQIPRSDPNWGQLRLELRKLGLLTEVSNESLSDDAFDLEGSITSIFAESLSFVIDEQLLVGKGGSYGPTGVLHQPSLVTVPRGTPQGSLAFGWQDFAAMAAAMWSNAISPTWIISNDAWPDVLSLFIPLRNDAGTDVVGGRAVWDTISASTQSFRILGWPVVRTEKCPPKDQKGAVMLVDWNSFQCIFKDFRIESDLGRGPGFERDTTLIRALARIDGSGLWRQSFTGRDGQEVSPFVALGA